MLSTPSGSAQQSRLVSPFSEEIVAAAGNARAASAARSALAGPAVPCSAVQSPQRLRWRGLAGLAMMPGGDTRRATCVPALGLRAARPGQAAPTLPRPGLLAWPGRKPWDYSYMRTYTRPGPAPATVRASLAAAFAFPRLFISTRPLRAASPGPRIRGGAAVPTTAGGLSASVGCMSALLGRACPAPPTRPGWGPRELPTRHRLPRTGRGVCQTTAFSPTPRFSFLTGEGSPH